MKSSTVFLFSLILASTLAAGALPAAGRHWPVPLERPDAAPGQSRGSRDYDVLHYDLELTPRVTAQALDGQTTIVAEAAAAGLRLVDFDLAQALEVLAVSDGSQPLAYSRTGAVIEVDLGYDHAAGESFQVVIAYHGDETGAFAFYDHDDTPAFSTTSCPSSSHTWWPCNENMADKATCDLAVTVPDWMAPVSQGVLTADLDNGDGTHTVTWETDHPIAPYLVSVAATDYVRLDFAYTPQAGGAPMPVPVWLYPELAGPADETFARTPEVIEFYAGIFGEYPFLDEKHGQATTQMGYGGMEHQTIVHLNATLIAPGDDLLELIAHELSHMWWGDCVTAVDWRHVWLHEGFATYSECLYLEHREGFEALKNRMRTYAQRDYQGSIYDPIHTFGLIVYQKGAWVLHMLRRLTGDATFAAILQAFYADERYRYGNAAIDDFQAVCEELAGLGSLDWFFQQWIYGTDRPDLEYTWSWQPAGRAIEMTLDIEQLQAEPPFQAPLDVDIVTAAGTVRQTVYLSQASHHFGWTLGEPPVDVILDPDEWLLDWQEFVPGTTPTPTPETSPTPSPTPSAVWYDLAMPDTDLAPGETFRLERSCGNPTAAPLAVDEYVILDVAAAYWFWPSWGQDLDWESWTLAAGATDENVILEFTWPEGAGEYSGVRFWGACLQAGTADLVIHDVIEWGFGGA